MPNVWSDIYHLKYNLLLTVGLQQTSAKLGQQYLNVGSTSGVCWDAWAQQTRDTEPMLI